MDIDRLRDGYRPAARRGAILFFVLSEMALVNAMYQYSLIAFLEVFGLSLKKSLPDSILMRRLRNIMDTLTFNIYNYGCTGEHPSGLRVCPSGVCVSTSLLLRTRGRWDQGPCWRPVYLHSLFRGPLSRHGHIWRPWGSEFQHLDLEEQSSAHSSWAGGRLRTVVPTGLSYVANACGQEGRLQITDVDLDSFSSVCACTCVCFKELSHSASRYP